MGAQQSSLDNRIILRNLFDEFFDLNDLKTLVFDLGINYGNIAGEIQRTKYESLILMMGQAGRLPELLELVAERRPDLPWPTEDWATYNWDGSFPQTVPTSLYADRPQEIFEPNMVFVPGGTFLMGSNIEDSATPQHKVSLTGFWISRAPVSNQEYVDFIQKERRVATPAMRWSGNTPPAGQTDEPVTGITWYEALDYCRWLSGETGRPYTLPNEAQWEKALRLADNEDGPSLTTIREWTATLWGRSLQTPDLAYRYPWADGRRNDLDEPATVLRVYRGGLARGSTSVDVANRAGFDPTKSGPRRSRHGFRVVIEIT